MFAYYFSSTATVTVSVPHVIKFYRVYSHFILEAIIATAFGRQVNLQRGESDEFVKAMETAMKGLASGQFENFTLIHSML
jgi:hypothetical protein